MKNILLTLIVAGAAFALGCLCGYFVGIAQTGEEAGKAFWQGSEYQKRLEKKYKK